MTTDKRRILLLTPDLRGDGGVTNYYNVLRLHELMPLEYFYVNSAAPERPVRRAWRLLVNYVRFAGKLLTGHYSLIHVNPSLNANSFYRDGLFLLIARLSRAPKLIFFRGWDDAFVPRLTHGVSRIFFRLTYSTCPNVVVLGRRFAERLAEDVGLTHARVWIETTVADRRAAAESADGTRREAYAGREHRPADKRKIVALFMARLLLAKGALIAIDSVARCNAAQRPEQRQIELWIAGAGADESQIKAHAAEHGADFVRFLGHVSGEEKWQVLEDADLLLFPTCHPEGLSNSVLEAMLHGLPILTRPEGALGEILTDDVNGFITSSTDPAVFAEQLARLANDDELRERISRFNREQAESRFTREIVTDRLLSIYDEILARSRP